MTTAQNAHAHTAPVVRPHETTRPTSTGAHHTNRASTATWVDADYVGNPYCERCGTDEFIYLEAFVPAKHRPDGTVKKLGEVTYFCTGCDDFSAHSVPASWVPPGWYFG